MISKNKKLTRTEIIKKMSEFYLKNINFIDGCLKLELNHKEFICKIFELLEYSKTPLKRNFLCEANKDITLYRGITATNEDRLKYYINQFIDGTVYFGIGPFVFGTGIYTCTSKNMEVAIKYATNSYENNDGAIIQCKLKKDIKIINYERLIKYQLKALKDLKSIFPPKYIKVLNDYGLFAAILGYECVYVESMDYFIILNRGKIIIEDIEYCNTPKTKKYNLHNKI